MRKQYCREHIRKVAEECDLGDDIVTEVERVDKFCGSNPAFADCATRPIYRLISIQDVDVRNKAISFAENALKEETPTGGKVRVKLTEPEILVLIRKANREIHGEPSEARKTKKLGPGPAKEPEKDRVADASKSITEEAPVQPPLSAQMAGTIPPEPPVHRPPPCLGGGGCDQKPSKFVADDHTGRGPVCSAVGRPTNQLPGGQCPYDIKLPRKSESAFVPASQLATANEDLEVQDLEIRGSKPANEDLEVQDLEIRGSKPAIPDRTLTIAFSPDQWEILGKLQKAGVADGYDGAVLFCVDEIGARSA